MNYYYLLKEIRKAEKKVGKVYKYLKTLETKEFDKQMQINIMRICDIDEILSNLEIDLEIERSKNNE